MRVARCPARFPILPGPAWHGVIKLNDAASFGSSRVRVGSIENVLKKWNRADLVKLVAGFVSPLSV
jgi:hypothetical protein